MEFLLSTRFQRAILIIYFVVSEIMFRRSKKKGIIIQNLREKFISIKTYLLTLTMNFLIFVPQVRDMEYGRLENTPNFIPLILIFISVFGLFFKIYSQITLNKPRGILNINKETLITDGPYKLVRHPGYLSNLLVWFPLLFCSTNNVILTLIFFVIAYGVLNERITSEEENLKTKFGELYEKYENNVPNKLIPFI